MFTFDSPKYMYISSIPIAKVQIRRRTDSTELIRGIPEPGPTIAGRHVR